MFKDQIEALLEKELTAEEAITTLELEIKTKRAELYAIKKARQSLEKLEETYGQATVSA